MIEGVIFDIDGVLVDSEPLHGKSLERAIRTVLEKDINLNLAMLIGLSLEETINSLGVKERDSKRIRQLATQYYIESANAKLVRPNIRELWSSLIKSRFKFGCVSTAEMKICRRNIELLSIGDVSHVPVVAFETVEFPKPHPMPYLKMLEILDLNPSKTIAIEDSELGISSARAAGIEEVYAWPHGLSEKQNYEKAKAVISDIREIEFVASLIEKDGLCSV